MNERTEKAVYPGNMGFTEMYQMVRNAPPDVGNQFLTFVNTGKYREAIKMMEDFHHIKFDPSIYGRYLIPSKKDPTKRRWQGKNMKHIIIQKANVDEYVRVKDGKPQIVKSHIRHVVTRDRLAKGFRLASYTHTLGKEESRRAKREKSQSGDWTPHEERFRERAKERREDYGEQPQ